MPKLASGLCGPFRPGHFAGVATVVCKLFNVVRPDVALFGEKDYQQLAIIRRMVIDLDMGIEIVGVPTVREPDGLAMSSRNAYLSPAERARALSLSRALFAARDAAAAGARDAAAIVARARAALDVDRIDYIELVDAVSLEAASAFDRPAVLAVAAFVGRTRLIDNVAIAWLRAAGAVCDYCPSSGSRNPALRAGAARAKRTSASVSAPATGRRPAVADATGLGPNCRSRRMRP